MSIVHQRYVVTPLDTKAVGTYNYDYSVVGARGLVLFLNVTAWGGAGATLDVKVQALVNALSGGSAVYMDIPGAAFTQKTQAGGATTDILQVYPHLVESANKKVSFVMPDRYRIVATVGTNTSTFAIEAMVLW